MRSKVDLINDMISWEYAMNDVDGIENMPDQAIGQAIETFKELMNSSETEALYALTRSYIVDLERELTRRGKLRTAPLVIKQGLKLIVNNTAD